MGYAFDSGIMEIPEEEALAIAIMNAKIRDNMLTPEEEMAKLSVKKPQYVCLFWEGTDDPYNHPYLYGVYVNEEVARKAMRDDYYTIYNKYLSDEEFYRGMYGFKFEMVLVKDYNDLLHR